MIKRRLGFAGILLAGLILVLYLTGGGKIFGRLGVSRCEKLWKESEEVMVEGEVYQKTRKEEKLILYLKKIQIREMGNGKAVADERLLVYLDEKGNGPEIGQRILVKGNVGFFDPAANPGNFDQKNYYKQQNIQAVLWKGKVLEKQVKKTSFREKLWQFRNRTADEICREMGTRRGGILCAVLLGDSFYTADIHSRFHKWERIRNAVDQCVRVFADRVFLDLAASQGVRESQLGWGENHHNVRAPVFVVDYFVSHGFAPFLYLLRQIGHL